MSLEERLKNDEQNPEAKVVVRHEKKVKRRVVKARPSATLPEVMARAEDGCPITIQNGDSASILPDSCPKVDSSSLDVPVEAVKDIVCGQCGTEVEFKTDKCPICGAPLDSRDNGLVRLFSDMEFKDDCSGEMDCPLCGERVMLQEGRCPSCLELVHEDCVDPAEKLDPVIHGDNVVFVHLDVENGELDCLQRPAHRIGLEHMTVKLEGER